MLPQRHLFSERKRQHSTPSSVGESNWHPGRHKFSSITFMPPAHAHAFASSEGPLSASKAVCLFVFAWVDWIERVCGSLEDSGRAGNGVSLSVYMCVAIWGIKTDGWVTHFKLFTFVAAKTFSSTVLFLALFMSFVVLWKMFKQTCVAKKYGLGLGLSRYQALLHYYHDQNNSW